MARGGRAVRVADVHRTFNIVETDWTTTVKVGFDKEEVRPVYVIPGLKERPSSPFLTTVEEAREYIDAELDGREAWKAESSEEFETVLKVRGAASVGLTVPADVARRMGLDVGDRVIVTIRRARGRPGGAGRRLPQGPEPPDRLRGRRESW
jgi:hypothetical protein